MEGETRLFETKSSAIPTMTHGLQSFQAKYLCSSTNFNSRYWTHICYQAEIRQKLKMEGWKAMVGAEPKCYCDGKEWR